MERIQSAIFWAIVASETSHVFCCVLPTIVSLASILTGLGLVSALPAGFETLHDFMHEYEALMVIFSGVVLAAGWGLYRLSLRLDCAHTGCHHEPCRPKKRSASLMLKIATVLFAVNLAVFSVHSWIG